MILEGDESVIAAIKEKKRLMDAGEGHEHIRPMLIIGAGLMRGVYGAGAVIALHEAGYTDVFDRVVAISTGAPTAAYFLGGNPRVGTSIYYEECCSPQFLKAKFLRNWLMHPIDTFRDPADIGYLEDVFKGSTGKAINCDAIAENRTNLFIVATDAKTGTTLFANTDTCGDLHTMVTASCLIPGFADETYVLDGKTLVDGSAGSMPLSDFALSLPKPPTHILYIANEAKDAKHRFEKITNWLIFNILIKNRMSRKIRANVLNRFTAFEDEIDELRDEHEAVAVVWSDGVVQGTETDCELLKDTVERSEAWWRTLLAK